MAQTPRWRVPQTGRTAHGPVGKNWAFMKDLEAASGKSLVFFKDLTFIYIKRKISKFVQKIRASGHHHRKLK